MGRISGFLPASKAKLLNRKRKVKLPGRPSHVKEADILKHTIEYLAWERLWHLRITAGTARVGGQPVKLSAGLRDTVAAAFPEAALDRWDGYLRIGEQFVKLAPEGTPDILLMIPSKRKVMNPSSREYETFPVARIAFIETKHPKTGRMGGPQAEFRDMCLKVGALYYVVSNPEDLRKYLPPRMELNFTGA